MVVRQCCHVYALQGTANPDGRRCVRAVPVCCAVGFIMGMVFGVLTRLFLRFMRCVGCISGYCCHSLYCEFPKEQQHACRWGRQVSWFIPIRMDALFRTLCSYGNVTRQFAGLLSVWLHGQHGVCDGCRYMGAGHDQEVALTVGMAYLAYWVTGQPCKGSGKPPALLGADISDVRIMFPGTVRLENV